MVVNLPREPKSKFFFFFFFLLISNIRILLIIEKVPSRVHWGCTMGAQIRKQQKSKY